MSVVSGSVVEGGKKPIDQPPDRDCSQSHAGKEPDDQEDRKSLQLVVGPVPDKHASQRRHEENKSDLGEESEIRPDPTGLNHDRPDKAAGV